MKISVQAAVLSEGWQPLKETIVPEGNPEKALQEVVDWFRTQLREALARREDVEVLLGRKPEGTVGELEEEAAEDVFDPEICPVARQRTRFVSRRQPGTPRPDYLEKVGVSS